MSSKEIENSLETILTKYSESFSEKVFSEQSSAEDDLMRVFGLTQEMKNNNRQYWGRELGACWERLVKELCQLTCDRFWIIAIESKQAAFSLEAGRSQLLTYMLANPHRDRPTYGLLTNGNSFLFVKLMRRNTPQYALSRLFYLFNPSNDLYSVLSVLKHLAEGDRNIIPRNGI
ncbi:MULTISPECIES: hypothetical protein [Spirulina sp. CCY15215]|uniref:hypothetical protein n=1 Tax=Spirulina sp. CCY15215 TaxID=2767591 RepID=UPI00194F6A32|nr:hypothetical protein [Spirulina major]